MEIVAKRLGFSSSLRDHTSFSVDLLYGNELSLHISKDFKKVRVFSSTYAVNHCLRRLACISAERTVRFRIPPQIFSGLV